MGRSCCVPGCRSNYLNGNYVSCFLFPKTEERRQLWIRKINRKDFTPSSIAVVCIKHFSEDFIIRGKKATRDDGTELVVQRAKPKLADDAYPSIFPNQPACLSKEPPQKRKTSSERLKETIEARHRATTEDGTELVQRESPKLTYGAYPSILPHQPACLSVEPPKKRKTSSEWLEEKTKARHGATIEDDTELLVQRESPKLADDAYPYPSILPNQPACLSKEPPKKRKTLTDWLEEKTNARHGATTGDDTELVVQRESPKVIDDAFPPILPYQPACLSKEPPKKKIQSERLEEIIKARHDAILQDRIRQDEITGFSEFQTKYLSKLCENWLSSIQDNFILIYKINCESAPRISVSIKILHNLRVQAFYGSISMQGWLFILKPTGKCDKWSKFDGLLNYFANFGEKSVPQKDKLNYDANVLKDYRADIENTGAPSNVNIIREQSSMSMSKK